MTISNSLELSLRYAFSFTTRSGNISNIRPSGNSILVRSVGAGSFIPSICLPVIATLCVNATYRNTVVPLVLPSNTIVKKTSDAIINSLFNMQGYGSYNHSLKYINTTKGYGYYGGKGLILTDNYEPLLICGYVMRMTSSGYNYIHPMCFISPDVFNREDMVSKCIVKKIIPFYSNSVVHSYFDSSSIYCDSNRVKVIISSEINELIHRAVEPLSTDVDTELYSILASNIASLQNW